MHPQPTTTVGNNLEFPPANAETRNCAAYRCRLHPAFFDKQRAHKYSAGHPNNKIDRLTSPSLGG